MRVFKWESPPDFTQALRGRTGKKKKHTISQVTFVKKASNGSFSWVGWTQFLWWWGNTSHCKIFLKTLHRRKDGEWTGFGLAQTWESIKDHLESLLSCLSFLSSQDYYHQLPGGKELKNCFLIKYCFKHNISVCLYLGLLALLSISHCTRIVSGQLRGLSLFRDKSRITECL